jgi:hypothetical protein
MDVSEGMELFRVRLLFRAFFGSAPLAIIVDT